MSHNNPNTDPADLSEAEESSSRPLPTPRQAPPTTTSKPRELWTALEHERFLEALSLYNRDWRAIEQHIGTKTVIQIRSHAQKHFMKLQKMGLSSQIPEPKPRASKLNANKQRTANLTRWRLANDEKLSGEAAAAAAAAQTATSTQSPITPVPQQSKTTPQQFQDYRPLPLSNRAHNAQIGALTSQATQSIQFGPVDHPQYPQSSFNLPQATQQSYYAPLITAHPQQPHVPQPLASQYPASMYNPHQPQSPQLTASAGPLSSLMPLNQLQQHHHPHPISQSGFTRPTPYQPTTTLTHSSSSSSTKHPLPALTRLTAQQSQQEDRHSHFQFSSSKNVYAVQYHQGENMYSQLPLGNKTKMSTPGSTTTALKQTLTTSAALHHSPLRQFDKLTSPIGQTTRTTPLHTSKLLSTGTPGGNGNGSSSSSTSSSNSLVSPLFLASNNPFTQVTPNSFSLDATAQKEAKKSTPPQLLIGATTLKDGNNNSSTTLVAANSSVSSSSSSSHNQKQKNEEKNQLLTPVQNSTNVFPFTYTIANDVAEATQPPIISDSVENSTNTSQNSLESTKFALLGLNQREYLLEKTQLIKNIINTTHTPKLTTVSLEGPLDPTKMTDLDDDRYLHQTLAKTTSPSVLQTLALPRPASSSSGSESGNLAANKSILQDSDLLPIQLGFNTGNFDSTHGISILNGEDSLQHSQEHLLQQKREITQTVRSLQYYSTNDNTLSMFRVTQNENFDQNLHKILQDLKRNAPHPVANSIASTHVADDAQNCSQTDTISASHLLLKRKLSSSSSTSSSNGVGIVPKTVTAHCAESAVNIANSSNISLDRNFSNIDQSNSDTLGENLPNVHLLSMAVSQVNPITNPRKIVPTPPKPFHSPETDENSENSFKSLKNPESLKKELNVTQSILQTLHSLNSSARASGLSGTDSSFLPLIQPRFLTITSPLQTSPYLLQQGQTYIPFHSSHGVPSGSMTTPGAPNPPQSHPESVQIDLSNPQATAEALRVHHAVQPSCGAPFNQNPISATSSLLPAIAPIPVNNLDIVAPVSRQAVTLNNTAIVNSTAAGLPNIDSSALISHEVYQNKDISGPPGAGFFNNVGKTNIASKDDATASLLAPGGLIEGDSAHNKGIFPFKRPTKTVTVVKSPDGIVTQTVTYNTQHIFPPTEHNRKLLKRVRTDGRENANMVKKEREDAVTPVVSDGIITVSDENGENKPNREIDDDDEVYYTESMIRQPGETYPEMHRIEFSSTYNKTTVTKGDGTVAEVTTTYIHSPNDNPHSFTLDPYFFPSSQSNETDEEAAQKHQNLLSSLHGRIDFIPATNKYRQQTSLETALYQLQEVETLNAYINACYDDTLVEKEQSGKQSPENINKRKKIDAILSSRNGTKDNDLLRSVLTTDLNTSPSALITLSSREHDTLFQHVENWLKLSKLALYNNVLASETSKSPDNIPKSLKKPANLVTKEYLMSSINSYVNLFINILSKDFHALHIQQQDDIQKQDDLSAQQNLQRAHLREILSVFNEFQWTDHASRVNFAKAHPHVFRVVPRAPSLMNSTNINDFDAQIIPEVMLHLEPNAGQFIHGLNTHHLSQPWRAQVRANSLLHFPNDAQRQRRVDMVTRWYYKMVILLFSFFDCSPTVFEVSKGDCEDFGDLNKKLTEPGARAVDLPHTANFNQRMRKNQSEELGPLFTCGHVKPTRSRLGDNSGKLNLCAITPRFDTNQCTPQQLRIINKYKRYIFNNKYLLSSAMRFFAKNEQHPRSIDNVTSQATVVDDTHAVLAFPDMIKTNITLLSTMGLFMQQKGTNSAVKHIHELNPVSRNNILFMKQRRAVEQLKAISMYNAIHLIIENHRLKCFAKKMKQQFTNNLLKNQVKADKFARKSKKTRKFKRTTRYLLSAQPSSVQMTDEPNNTVVQLKKSISLNGPDPTPLNISADRTPPLHTISSPLLLSQHERLTLFNSMPNDCKIIVSLILHNLIKNVLNFDIITILYNNRLNKVLYDLNLMYNNQGVEFLSDILGRMDADMRTVLAKNNMVQTVKYLADWERADKLEKADKLTKGEQVDEKESQVAKLCANYYHAQRDKYYHNMMLYKQQQHIMDNIKLNIYNTINNYTLIYDQKYYELFNKINLFNNHKHSTTYNYQNSLGLHTAPLTAPNGVNVVEFYKFYSLFLQHRDEDEQLAKYTDPIANCVYKQHQTVYPLVSCPFASNYTQLNLLANFPQINQSEIRPIAHINNKALVPVQHVIATPNMLVYNYLYKRLIASHIDVIARLFRFLHNLIIETDVAMERTSHQKHVVIDIDGQPILLFDNPPGAQQSPPAPAPLSIDDHSIKHSAEINNDIVLSLLNDPRSDVIMDMNMHQSHKNDPNAEAGLFALSSTELEKGLENEECYTTLTSSDNGATIHCAFSAAPPQKKKSSLQHPYHANEDSSDVYPMTLPLIRDNTAYFSSEALNDSITKCYTASDGSIREISRESLYLTSLTAKYSKFIKPEHVLPRASYKYNDTMMVVTQAKSISKEERHNRVFSIIAEMLKCGFDTTAEDQEQPIEMNDLISLNHAKDIDIDIQDIQYLDHDGNPIPNPTLAYPHTNNNSFPPPAATSPLFNAQARSQPQQPAPQNEFYKISPVTDSTKNKLKHATILNRKILVLLLDHFKLEYSTQHPPSEPLHTANNGDGTAENPEEYYDNILLEKISHILFLFKYFFELVASPTYLFSGVDDIMNYLIGLYPSPDDIAPPSGSSGRTKRDQLHRQYEELKEEMLVYRNAGLKESYVFENNMLHDLIMSAKTQQFEQELKQQVQQAATQAQGQTTGEALSTITATYDTEGVPHGEFGPQSSIQTNVANASMMTLGEINNAPNNSSSSPLSIQSLTALPQSLSISMQELSSKIVIKNQASIRSQRQQQRRIQQQLSLQSSANVGAESMDSVNFSTITTTNDPSADTNPLSELGLLNDLDNTPNMTMGDEDDEDTNVVINIEHDNQRMKRIDDKCKKIVEYQDQLKQQHIKNLKLDPFYLKNVEEQYNTAVFSHTDYIERKLQHNDYLYLILENFNAFSDVHETHRIGGTMIPPKYTSFFTNVYDINHEVDQIEIRQYEDGQQYYLNNVLPHLPELNIPLPILGDMYEYDNALYKELTGISGNNTSNTNNKFLMTSQQYFVIPSNISENVNSILIYSLQTLGTVSLLNNAISALSLDADGYYNNAMYKNFTLDRTNTLTWIGPDPGDIDTDEIHFDTTLLPFKDWLSQKLVSLRATQLAESASKRDRILHAQKIQLFYKLFNHHLIIQKSFVEQLTEIAMIKFMLNINNYLINIMVGTKRNTKYRSPVPTPVPSSSTHKFISISTEEEAFQNSEDDADDKAQYHAFNDKFYKIYRNNLVNKYHLFNLHYYLLDPYLQAIAPRDTTLAASQFDFPVYQNEAFSNKKQTADQLSRWVKFIPSQLSINDPYCHKMNVRFDERTPPVTDILTRSLEAMVQQKYQTNHDLLSLQQKLHISEYFQHHNAPIPLQISPHLQRSPLSIFAIYPTHPVEVYSLINTLYYSNDGYKYLVWMQQLHHIYAVYKQFFYLLIIKNPQTKEYMLNPYFVSKLCQLFPTTGHFLADKILEYHCYYLKTQDTGKYIITASGATAGDVMDVTQITLEQRANLFHNLLRNKYIINNPDANTLIINKIQDDDSAKHTSTPSPFQKYVASLSPTNDSILSDIICDNFIDFNLIYLVTTIKEQYDVFMNVSGNPTGDVKQQKTTEFIQHITRLYTEKGVNEISEILTLISFDPSLPQTAFDQYFQALNLVYSDEDKGRHFVNIFSMCFNEFSLLLDQYQDCTNPTNVDMYNNQHFYDLSKVVFADDYDSVHISENESSAAQSPLSPSQKKMIANLANRSVIMELLPFTHHPQDNTPSPTPHDSFNIDNPIHRNIAKYMYYDLNLYNKAQDYQRQAYMMVVDEYIDDLTAVHQKHEDQKLEREKQQQQQLLDQQRVQQSILPQSQLTHDPNTLPVLLNLPPVTLPPPPVVLPPLPSLDPQNVLQQLDPNSQQQQQQQQQYHLW